MNSNSISLIEAKAFNNLNQLKSIDLSDNQISNINMKTFIGSCQIDSVLVEYNPIANTFSFSKSMCLSPER